MTQGKKTLLISVLAFCLMVVLVALTYLFTWKVDVTDMLKREMSRVCQSQWKVNCRYHQILFKVLPRPSFTIKKFSMGKEDAPYFSSPELVMSFPLMSLIRQQRFDVSLSTQRTSLVIPEDIWSRIMAPPVSPSGKRRGHLSREKGSLFGGLNPLVSRAVANKPGKAQEGWIRSFLDKHIFIRTVDLGDLTLAFKRQGQVLFSINQGYLLGRRHKPERFQWKSGGEAFIKFPRDILVSGQAQIGVISRSISPEDPWSGAIWTSQINLDETQWSQGGELYKSTGQLARMKFDGKISQGILSLEGLNLKTGAMDLNLSGQSTEEEFSLHYRLKNPDVSALQKHTNKILFPQGQINAFGNLQGTWGQLDTVEGSGTFKGRLSQTPYSLKLNWQSLSPIKADIFLKTESLNFPILLKYFRSDKNAYKAPFSPLLYLSRDREGEEGSHISVRVESSRVIFPHVTLKSTSLDATYKGFWDMEIKADDIWGGNGTFALLINPRESSSFYQGKVDITQVSATRVFENELTRFLHEYKMKINAKASVSGEIRGNKIQSREFTGTFSATQAANSPTPLRNALERRTEEWLSELSPMLPPSASKIQGFQKRFTEALKAIHSLRLTQRPKVKETSKLKGIFGYSKGVLSLDLNQGRLSQTTSLSLNVDKEKVSGAGELHLTPHQKKGFMKQSPHAALLWDDKGGLSVPFRLTGTLEDPGFRMETFSLEKRLHKNLVSFASRKKKAERK